MNNNKRSIVLVNLMLVSASAMAGPVIVNTTPKTTTGDNEDAIVIFDSDAEIQNSSTVQTFGVSADALRISGDRGTVTNGESARVETNGDGFAVGIRVRGDEMSIRNEGTIVTNGTNGDGIVVFGDSTTNGYQGSQVFNSGSITVNGVGADGFVIEGDNTSFTNTGSVINNADVRTALPDGTPLGGSDNGTGIYLAGANNTLQNHSGGIIRTSGEDSTTVRVFAGGSIDNDGLIENSGAVTGNVPSIVSGAAIAMFGADITLNNSGTIVGNIVGGVGNQVVNLDRTSEIIGSVNVGIADSPTNDRDQLNYDTGNSGLNRTINGSSFLGFETFTKSGNRALLLNGDLDLTTLGEATVESGLLSLNADSTLTANTLRVKRGAQLGGTGTVNGSVIVESVGIIGPGFSPGILDITGDLELYAGSQLIIEVTGADPGDFDVVNVGGTARLFGGEIVFDFQDYLPKIGDMLDFLTASAGIFIDPSVAVTFAGVSDSFRASLTATAAGVVFEALNDALPVPAPATWILTVSGLLLIILRRRDNRSRSFTGEVASGAAHQAR